jgi:hypothetical protein
MELAAANVVTLMRTPVANGFLNRDGHVDWQKVEDRFDLLSGSERALVHIAAQLADRRRIGGGNHSLFACIARLDVRDQHEVVATIIRLFDDAQIMPTVDTES